MSTDHYDLVVIGSGPAGEKGAAKAAYFGKRVALVEKEPVLGGAAANTGTVPSKTLRETALFLSGFRQRQLAGLQFRLKEQVTVADFMARERIVKESERRRIQENLRRHRITLYQGAATFADAHTVAVRPGTGAETRLSGDVFLIATGSYPFRPPGFPFEDPRVYDSDTVLSLRDIPPSLLVVGGGVIGCEYACMFAALGVRVSVVEKRNRLIESLDAEMSASLQARMEAMGVLFHLGDGVNTVKAGDKLQIALQSGTNVEVDALLISSGRCGQVAGLGLERIGVKADERGRILVNERYQTAVQHIYAAGDVIGSPGLASTSMEQGRLAMANAFDLKYRDPLPTILPYGIYTIPECSMAGPTEEALKKQGTPYVAGKASYGGNARGQIIGDPEGFLKLLFHRDDMRLLGVHVIGELATELVHVGLTAMMLGATADLFIQTCFNYPTLTELYKYAAYDALGRRSPEEGHVLRPVVARQET